MGCTIVIYLCLVLHYFSFRSSGKTFNLPKCQYESKGAEFDRVFDSICNEIMLFVVCIKALREIAFGRVQYYTLNLYK